MRTAFQPRSIAAFRNVLLLMLALASPHIVHAAEPAIPIAAFFANPSLGGAKLSPDGRHLAMRVNNSSGHDQLGIVDLSNNAMQVVAAFKDADVGRFEWVNDKRLIYDSRDLNTAPGKERFAPGLFAVNVDGSLRRQLVATDGQFVVEAPAGREKLPWNTYMLDQPGAQDSDWVYVATVKFGRDRGEDRVELLRLDTVSTRTETVQGPGHTREWWLDARGRPALATTVENNVEALHYLDPKDGRWRKLATSDAYLGGEASITPVGFAPDGGLYVASRGKRDKYALFAYDLGAGKVAAQPLVDLDEYDFSGALVTSATRLLGVRYTLDSEAVAWFDPGMKAAQEAVDKLLPGRVNALSVGVRSATPFVLVESWSDRQPPVFLLFNRDSGKLSKVGDSRPAIAPSKMAAQALVQVKARDGRTIPAWVTLPNDSNGKGAGKKLPMVVLVHGGPYVRGGEWQWSADSQFLASRGYAVLQPEYRGSTGFGADHFRAGWKQWGLAMQDDIADATRWAIAEGIADPQRICIAGASYGGYATLMGLIRDPALYKCGIDWVGVTDIALLYNGHWSQDSDMSAAYKRYGMPTLVGDPVKDAAQFAATSPLKQAARITQPLLLAYGGADKRVPLYHGRQFYDALRQTNKQVEWVVYDEEGHGWTLMETRLDFWGRVERFLQRQIGR